MPNRPFKPLTTTASSPSTPTSSGSTISPTNTIGPAQPPSVRTFNVLYRDSRQSRKAPWTGDATLAVSSTGNAALRIDEDTHYSNGDSEQNVLARGMIRLPLSLGARAFLGKYMLQVGEEEQTVADRNSEISRQPRASVYATGMSMGALQPFRNPRLAIQPLPTPLQELTHANLCCEECNQTQEPCGGQFPCQNCIDQGNEFCSVVDSHATFIKRTPVSPGNDQRADKQTNPQCINCRIFGLACDSRTPCIRCMRKRRAYCTIEYDDGTVISARCCAFRISTGYNGDETVALDPRYEPDSMDEWPLWPPAKPSRKALAWLTGESSPTLHGWSMDSTKLSQHCWSLQDKEKLDRDAVV